MPRARVWVDLMSPKGPSPWPWMIRVMLGPANLAPVDIGGKGGGAKYWYGFPSSNSIHQGPFSQVCAKSTRGLTIGGSDRFQGV